MKLTKHSELLMSFFLEKKCIYYSEQTEKTDRILKKLYHDLRRADTFVKQQKLKEGDRFYKVTVAKIHSISQIPRPSSFNQSSFPKEIREHIDASMLYSLTYTFSLFGREIIVHFIVEHHEPEYQIELYNEYIEKILVWLHVINEYASKKCSKRLVLFLYFTSLKKQLPASNIHILNQNNVNTAFTYTCPVDSEIVVFRQEEWLKVLMHESFHNFALDFSDMNIQECTKHILSIFKVDSEVNLFEAYTECWAEIMNASFCSYYSLKDGSTLDDFLSNWEFFINFERTYKFFQMVKTLEFMGLTYKDLYSTTTHSVAMREALYREDSNVLAYYIITTILMNNVQGFLAWCDKNNLALLQFKKTTSNIGAFCKFIEKNYKTKNMLASVACMQTFYHSLQKGKKSGNKKEKEKEKEKEKDKKIDFILNNMRMTICELG